MAQMDGVMYIEGWDGPGVLDCVLITDLCRRAMRVGGSEAIISSSCGVKVGEAT